MSHCNDCGEWVDDKWKKVHNERCKVISLRGLIRYKPFKYVMGGLIVWCVFWSIGLLMGW